jgi:hypothetical protein
MVGGGVDELKHRDVAGIVEIDELLVAKRLCDNSLTDGGSDGLKGDADLTQLSLKAMIILT